MIIRTKEDFDAIRIGSKCLYEDVLFTVVEKLGNVLKIKSTMGYTVSVCLNSLEKDKVRFEILEK